MKCFPSGRNTGQRWPASERDVSSFVNSAGVPPEDETRDNAPKASRANMIVPSGFHAPPRPLGASHSTWTCPPDTSTFLSLPSAKNPIDLPSGDQNGKDAPCVPTNKFVWRPPTSFVQSA